ncbi:MAG TPA: DUF983 domain-containing protein [Flavobacterium sp.]|jgi:uncharacterized protein (DUF983 family)|uniref:DUF983 domain-containing protein n=1 Tax=Flavobacterium sp. TaxID=239 RepID=UPI002B74D4A2|nr:DUF983 domain-containing protein [Flavobacterium sp.]HPW98634.1 DUF983 domain-containing protein [Flavobacterium sp.]HQA74715.1 DUF983 domain-containing protein [Flavobacterium sp.]
MLKKGSKLYSILTGSCPRCHEENMYVDKNPYHLSKLYQMHETCSHCKLQYKIEPSFFYGAMYVSYGLTVAIGVATFIVAKVFIGLDLFFSFMAIIAALILTTPITFRLARNIYINIFVHYNPEATKNVHND